jgi:hypothetical protein
MLAKLCFQQQLEHTGQAGDTALGVLQRMGLATLPELELSVSPVPHQSEAADAMGCTASMVERAATWISPETALNVAMRSARMQCCNERQRTANDSAILIPVYSCPRNFSCARHAPGCKAVRLDQTRQRLHQSTHTSAGLSCSQQPTNGTNKTAGLLRCPPPPR